MNELKVISLSQSIADLTDDELRDLAIDLVTHYRGRAMYLETYIHESRDRRIDNLIERFRD